MSWDSRHILHKSKLEDFKAWLDKKDIPHRDGKGAYQVLQILTPIFGWQCVFIKEAMPEHFSVNEKLIPIVRRFINNK